ncbi:acyltransferase family protein [Bacillus mycoides]|uniref:acyltransferase family protein n=1 Tax=Bacillus mycoides TaxID=1405 RepID=UPI0011A9A3AC|nr:acyltransferase [Bacillus mycoides]
MSKRYDELDSIRGIASLSVVFHHCFLCFSVFLAAHFHDSVNNTFVKILSNSPLHIFWAGHEAVILFFILSGFVLSLPFLNNVKQYYPDYIIKRFFRIYTPYIITVVISGLLFTILKENNSNDLSNWFNQMWSNPITPTAIISYVFMLGLDTHNLSTTSWSLVHELRISIFFPFIMILVMKFDWKKSLPFGLILTYGPWGVLSYLGSHIPNKEIAFLFNSFSNTFYYASFFVIGAVLAKYKETLVGKLNTLHSKTKFILSVLTIFLYTIEWNISILGNLKYNSKGTQLLITNLFVDCLIAIGVLILFVFALSSIKFQKILKTRFLLHMGKISYSLYLIHPIILLLFVYFAKGVLPLASLFLFVPFLSILIAHFMYIYIEKPSMLLGKKIVQNKMYIKRFKQTA